MDIPKVRFLLAIFLLSVTLVPAAETDWLKLAVKAHQEALYSLSNRQIENFLRTHNQDPRRDFAYLLRAVNYLQLKNFPEAESSLLKLLSDFPQSVYGREAYRYLILVRLQQGKVELAFSDYTTFGEKYGQDDNLSAQVGLALFSRGVVLFNQGERKGSREIFQKFLNAFPGQEQVASAFYYLGLMEYQENRFREAINYLQKARTGKMSQTVLADIYLKLGDCYLNSQQPEEAAPYYQKVLSDFPGFPQRSAVYYNLAVIARRKTDYDQARSLLQQLLTEKTTPKMAAMALLELGRLSLLEENWSRAQGYFQEVIGKYPESEFLPEALLQLGLINFNQNNLQVAADYFQKCLEQAREEPMRIQAFFGLGYTFYKSDRLAEARQQWNQVLERAPGSTFASEALFLLGRKEFDAGDYLSASRDFQTLLSRFPESNLSRLALPLLIESLVQQKKLDQASELCLKYLPAAKGDDLKVLFGKVLYLNKNWERARQVLSGVSKAQPLLKAEALFYLGQVELALGRKAEAEQHFLEVITYYPDIGQWSRLARQALGQKTE